jgi:hypothetical protein
MKRVIRRASKLFSSGEHASQQYSRWRLAIFLTGFLVCLFFYKSAWYHSGNFSLVVFLVILFTVSQSHSRLKHRLHRLRLWRQIKEAHLARLRLDWSNIPNRTFTTPEGHTYASDLDITGTHSLLSLIDVTFSVPGQARLIEWLLNQNQTDLGKARWSERQQFVKELQALTLLRDRMILETQLLSADPLSGDRIHALLEKPMELSHLNTIVFAATGLCLVTFSLFLAWSLFQIPGYWIVSFGCYVILYFSTAGHLSPVFGRVLDLRRELEKLEAITRRLEHQSFHFFPTLQNLTLPLTSSPHRPSASLRQLARLSHGLSVKAHPLVHLILNALVPWDLALTLRLTRICNVLRPTLPVWLDRIATVDAASSLATFAYLHPTYYWPHQKTLPDQNPSPSLRANNLGHPLIPAGRRIMNDIDLRDRGQIFLVTDSNMSGKSTFLRTVGINVCLAQAGAPVCAEAFDWTWMRIYCCIRITDSLDEGLSYFYAEVKRLKVILDAVKDGTKSPVLFLIDEIYKGTNNRERLRGSESFIQALRLGHGLGLITTHDLELAQLESDGKGVINVHFQETVEGGKLLFDFRLRRGPCPTTNALRIMAQEGLPIPKEKL